MTEPTGYPPIEPYEHGILAARGLGGLFPGAWRFAAAKAGRD